MLWEILAGAVLSISTTLGVEYLRLPKLDILIEEEPSIRDYRGLSKPAERAKFLRVKLWNQSPNWFEKILNKVIPLSEARNCHGYINFYRFNGTPIFTDPMKLRWSGSHGPFKRSVVREDKIITFIDPTIVSDTYWRTCYPNKVETIDIACRFDDDSEAYGWTTESMIGEQLWRKPEFKISEGIFIVSIEVRTENRRAMKYFQLNNDSGVENFQLINAKREDIKKISS